MNLLNGFDLVYAVTQDTINKQLQLLWVESALPTAWVYSPKNKKYSINAPLGPATVDMNTGDSSSRKVHVTFPLTGGKMNYLYIGEDADGTPVIDTRSVDATGWSLSV